MNSIFRVLFILNLALTITLGIFHFSQRQKIALVRTPEVLSRYNGMLEAEALLKEKKNEYLSRLDTLKVLYNRELESLSTQRNKLSKREITLREERIEQRHQDYIRYQEIADNKFSEDQKNITEGAINQVNDYIKAYAEEHKLKVVIGSNITGNVLYGHPDLDITEDIIKGLNGAYR